MDPSGAVDTSLILALVINFPALAALIYIIVRNERRYDRMADLLQEIVKTQTRMLAIIEAVGLEKKS